MSWLVYFISFVLGSVGAWGVFRYGHFFHLVDVANHRSSHSGSIPKGGGIGILFSFILACIYFNFSIGYWLPVVIISTVSLIGDRYELSVRSRLFIQIICALVVVSCFVQEKSQNNFLFLSFMVFFIVGTANIYNFMDGINGIAGITSIVSFGSLGIYLYLTDVSSVFVGLCIVIVLSSSGFLPFNLPQAKVFLGDVGSILLGFVFSSIIIMVSDNYIEFITMSGFLFLFYFDEVITMCARIDHGESLIKPHRKHLYQLLVNEMKIEHWKVSVAYGFIQAIISFAIIIVPKKEFWQLLILYLICILILLPVSSLIQKKAAY